MLTRFDNYNFHFSIDGLDFHVSNIVFEQFKRSIPRHSHSKNSYEIHYIPFGCGHACIDGKDYAITPNTLFITGPYVEHEQIPSKLDPMCEYCIYLKIEHSVSPHKAAFLQTAGSASEKALAKAFEQTFFWFGQDSQDIHTLMKQLFFELERRIPGYCVMAEAFLSQLIVKLTRNYEDNKEAGANTGFQDLNDNKYLIVEECFLYEYQNLTLEKLASRLGLGVRQTERLLKEHYGKTFLQKKTEARMSAASILLQNPDKNITAVSGELGYSSVEHFSAAFKRYYGESATSYRKRSL